MGRSSSLSTLSIDSQWTVVSGGLGVGKTNLVRGRGITSSGNKTTIIFYGRFTPPPPSSSSPTDDNCNHHHDEGPSFRAFRDALQEYVKYHVVSGSSTTTRTVAEEEEEDEGGLDVADKNELVNIFPFLKRLLFANDDDDEPRTTNLPASDPKNNNNKCGPPNHQISCWNNNHYWPGATTGPSSSASMYYHVGLPDLVVKLFRSFPPTPTCAAASTAGPEGTTTDLNNSPCCCFVLEDWHYADEPSMAILAALFVHRDTIRVPIVCTCRDHDDNDNNNNSNSQWRELKRHMLLSSTTRHVQLGNWQETDVRQWLEREFFYHDDPKTMTILLRVAIEKHHGRRHCFTPAQLSRLVMSRTKGNPLFSFYFVQMMLLEETDMIEMRGSGTIFHEDNDETRLTTTTTTAVDATDFGDSESSSASLSSSSGPVIAVAVADVHSLVDCLRRIITVRRPETWPTLKSLAAAIRVGNGWHEEFQPQLIAIMSGQTEQMVRDHLQVLPYLFVWTGGGSTVRFKHDAVRQSILAVMSDDDLALTHYDNGSRLCNHFRSIVFTGSNNNNNNKHDDTILFLAVNELQGGVAYITDLATKMAFTTLSLRAAERAMGSSRFRLARSYLDTAIGCLGGGAGGGGPWAEKTYEALLTLHNLAAEAAYAAGDFVQMDAYLEAVFGQARSFRDSLRARCTQMFANGARFRPNAANDALDLLKQLGVDLPFQPSRLLLCREFIKTRWLLRHKTDIDFLRLPVATDPDAIALMQVFSFAFTSFYASNPKLALLSTFRTIPMIFEYGVTGSAITAISTYSFLLCGAFGWIDEAYRYGKIACQMGQAYGARPYVARIGLGFFGYVAVWVEPYRVLFEPLRGAYRLAMQTGDMETATFACAVLVIMALDSGRPLDGIEREARSFCQAMDRLNQTVGLSITMIMYTFIVRDLLGRPMPDLDLQGSVQDAETARSPGGYVDCLHLSLQAMLLCLQGQHEACIAVSKRVRASFFETNPCNLFFESVSLLIAARSSSSQLARMRFHHRGRHLCRLFGRWAQKCPANFRGKYALLRAELCAGQYGGRQHLAAIKWYEQAIAWSAQGKLPVDEGLANACLGNYFYKLGCQQQLAIPFFLKAKDAYQRWGAVTLVAHMDAVIDIIYSSESAPRHNPASTTPARSVVGTSGQSGTVS